MRFMLLSYFEMGLLVFKVGYLQLYGSIVCAVWKACQVVRVSGRERDDLVELNLS